MSILNSKLVEVSSSSLTVSKLNVRKKKLVQGISELATDIQTHGQLQPILVRYEGDQMCVIAGQRRLAAIQKLNEANDTEILVSAVLVECDDTDAMRLSTSENFFQSAMT